MNKKLSRLVALGLLATTLWQPVAILAESNTSTSSQTSSTATAGTQVVGNDTVGYLTLPEATKRTKLVTKTLAVCHSSINPPTHRLA